MDEMRLSDKRFPDFEAVKCGCGKVFKHKLTRWVVKCPNCLKTARLHDLRCEWRQRQPNAAADDAKRDAIMATTAYARGTPMPATQRTA